jgi:hypothetical protein
MAEITESDIRLINKMSSDISDIILVLDYMIPYVFAEGSNDMTNIGSAMLKYPRYELKFKTLASEIKERNRQHAIRRAEVYGTK